MNFFLKFNKQFMNTWKERFCLKKSETGKFYQWRMLSHQIQTGYETTQFLNSSWVHSQQ